MGKTDNKTQCPSSSQCSLAAYKLLQAEETRNENCGINQSKKQEMYECQISKHATENFGTYQLSLTGWLTPCNYMSYEMPEYIFMQFLRILQDLMCG
jgi:hypothetical protein